MPNTPLFILISSQRGSSDDAGSGRKKEGVLRDSQQNVEPPRENLRLTRQKNHDEALDIAYEVDMKLPQSQVLA
jgi:hypothetical protein